MQRFGLMSMCVRVRVFIYDCLVDVSSSFWSQIDGGVLLVTFRHIIILLLYVHSILITYITCTGHVPYVYFVICTQIRNSTPKNPMLFCTQSAPQQATHTHTPGQVTLLTHCTYSVVCNITCYGYVHVPFIFNI